jgi:beta-glucanase (GH16 family)
MTRTLRIGSAALAVTYLAVACGTSETPIESGTGGAVGTGGQAGVGGTTLTTGGTSATGGAISATGGTTTSSGGASSGGVATGGTATGGKATGGAVTGGTPTGGKATGGAATGGAPPTGGTTPGSITCGTHTISTTGYTLAWSDEFSGTSLDTSKWTALSGPDNVNNNADYMLPQNVTVSGGYLNITAKAESYGGRNWTAGAIGSYGKYTFQYGKVVGCIKMPIPAPGYWPAFWMIGDYTTSWPSCGEIDIMENIGTNMVVGTLHWGTTNTTAGSSTTTTVDAFHAYEMIWDAQHIAFLVDDVQYFTTDISSASMAALRSHYYFWINFAIGGVGSWPGPVTSATPFPAVYQVDYVRVYQ